LPFRILHFKNLICLTLSDTPVRYEMRKAARAVLMNENHQIALLHVANDCYCKLPGGEIEGNEAIQAIDSYQGSKYAAKFICLRDSLILKEAVDLNILSFVI
jgi:hypothetical protein